MGELWCKSPPRGRLVEDGDEAIGFHSSVTFLMLLGRAILAMVFGAAGLAKAVDRDGTARTLAGFGVPEALAAPAARLLPIVELLCAVELLPASTARPAAAAALALLVIFSTAAAVA